MAESGNWLKLHRRILDSRVFSDEKCLKLWVWCLCKANFKTGYFRGAELPPGSFATGRLVGAQECKLSESSFYRGMKKLEEWGMIEQKSNKHWTHVSICHWHTYQQPEDDERTTSEQQADNKRTASERPSEREADTIEECKEGEEGKNAKKEKKKTVQKILFEDQDMEIAQWMQGLILEILPGARTPNFECWAREIRLMRERDQRTPESIREVFSWANSDSFWKSNILSPAKLREKYESLLLRMQERQNGKSRYSPGPGQRFPSDSNDKIGSF